MLRCVLALLCIWFTVATPTYFDTPPNTFNVRRGRFDVNVTVSVDFFASVTALKATVRCNFLPVTLKTISAIAPFMNSTIKDFWNSSLPIVWAEASLTLQSSTAQTILHASNFADQVVITKCAVHLTYNNDSKPSFLDGRPTIAIEPGVFAVDPLSQSNIPGIVACYEYARILNDESKWLTNRSYPWSDLAAASGRPGATNGGDYFKCQGIANSTFCTSIIKMYSWTGYCLPNVCNHLNVGPAINHLRGSELVRLGNPELIMYQTLVDRKSIEQDWQGLLNLTDPQVEVMDKVLTAVLVDIMARLGPMVQNALTVQETENASKWECPTHDTTPPQAMWLWVGAVFVVFTITLICSVLDQFWTAKRTLGADARIRFFSWPSWTQENAVALHRTLIEPGGQSPMSSTLDDSEDRSKHDWTANTAMGELVKMWSLKRNWKGLIAVREGPLQFFDGIRVFSAGWVVLGHTEVYALITTFVANPQKIFPFHRQPRDLSAFWYQIIPGGYFAVDTFLWLGGFFATFMVLRKGRRAGKMALALSLPLVYLNRYLRLLPSLLFVLGAFWFLLPNVGEGPFWIYPHKNEEHSCAKFWWAETFFLVGWNDQWLTCIGVTWYITCDMFYFVCTPFLLILYLHKGPLAIALIIFLGVASCSYYLYLSHHYSLSASTVENTGPGFNKTYYNPLTRASPYLVGVLFGMLFDFVWQKTDKLHKRSEDQAKENGHEGGDKRSSKKKNDCGDLKLSWRVSLALELTGLLLVALCVFGLYDALKDLRCTRYDLNCPDTGYRWSQSVSDVYNVFSRLGFAIGLSLMSTAWIWGTSWLPIARWILTRPIMSPLGKLAFMTYLWHTFFIRWFYGVQPTPLYYLRLNILIWWLGFVGVGFSAALVSYLFVEAPFANMQTRYMGKLEAKLRRPRR